MLTVAKLATVVTAVFGTSAWAQQVTYACDQGRTVPATRCVEECGITRPGSDFRQVRLNGANALQQCAAICDADAQCLTAQYRKDNRVCYLKRRVNRPVPDDNVIGIVCSKTNPPATCRAYAYEAAPVSFPFTRTGYLLQVASFDDNVNVGIPVNGMRERFTISPSGRLYTPTGRIVYVSVGGESASQNPGNFVAPGPATNPEDQGFFPLTCERTSFEFLSCKITDLFGDPLGPFEEYRACSNPRNSSAELDTLRLNSDRFPCSTASEVLRLLGAGDGVEVPCPGP